MFAFGGKADMTVTLILRPGDVVSFDIAAQTGGPNPRHQIEVEGV